MDGIQVLGKYPSNDANESKKILENPARKDEFTFPPKDLDLLSNTNEKEPLWKCRYVVVVMGCLIFFQITCYRLNTSISIVALSNNTGENSNSHTNVTSASCPFELLEDQGTSVNKIEGEMFLSPETQGYILGSNFLGYLITELPGGLMAEQISAKITVILGIFIASVCHLLSPLAIWTNNYFIILVQFIRGLAQGLIPPAGSVLASNWAPIKERGILNTFSLTGLCFGALLGGSATGILCASNIFGGWPSVFYIFGLLGIALSIGVQLFIYDSPKTHPRITNSELNYILQNQELDIPLKRPPVPWKKILTSAPVYAVTLAMSGQFWALTHFEAVHPIFLGTILHYPIEENGLLTSLPFVLQIICALCASCISTWLIKQNYAGVDKVRKGCHCLFSLIYSMCLLGIYAAGCNKAMSAPFATIAMGCIGISFAGSMITVVDMSPTYAGTLMGASSIVSSLSGFAMPILVGYMTNEKQTLEQWNKIFFISIAIVMGTGIIFWVFGSAEIQEWNFPTPESQENDEIKSKPEVTEFGEQTTSSGKKFTHL